MPQNVHCKNEDMLIERFLKQIGNRFVQKTLQTKNTAFLVHFEYGSKDNKLQFLPILHFY